MLVVELRNSKEKQPERNALFCVLPVMKLKSNTDWWFAAGAQTQKALGILSDGAFRLHLHVCMKAHRGTGRYLCTLTQLAIEIGRSRRSVLTYADELRRIGVWVIRSSVNQNERGEIEISDQFWPYEKREKLECPADLDYVDAIRAFLNDRACINSRFGIAEQDYARSLRDSHVSLCQVKRAVDLACLRKYISMSNLGKSQIISTFLYFRDAIDEVVNSTVSEDYWDYVADKVARLEKTWNSPHNHKQ